MTELLQFSVAGLSVGAAYALAGLGFTLIFNASGVINFAQGEFIMLGGMLSYVLVHAGVPLPLAVLAAIVATALVGMAVELFAIEPARNADVISLIIITIGVSLIIRGMVQAMLGSGIYRLPAFGSEQPLVVMGALIQPQNLWIFGVAMLALAALSLFFAYARLGKAMLATSYNRLAAMLVGVNVRRVLLASFAMSATLGALGGALIAPIALTSYDSGLLLGMKGFVAAILGGLGRPVGAVAGGLLVGLAEMLSAAYISSAYKDAVPFIIVLLVFMVRPTGLFGKSSTERV